MAWVPRCLCFELSVKLHQTKLFFVSFSTQLIFISTSYARYRWIFVTGPGTFRSSKDHHSFEVEVCSCGWIGLRVWECMRFSMAKRRVNFWKRQGWAVPKQCWRKLKKATRKNRFSRGVTRRHSNVMWPVTYTRNRFSNFTPCCNALLLFSVDSRRPENLSKRMILLFTIIVLVYIHLQQIPTSQRGQVPGRRHYKINC